MESIWQKTSQFSPRPELEGDISAEIAVIGGGLTGILTAHYLTEAGKDVVVLEAGRIGGGQTGRTSAKITAQHGLKYAELITRRGKEVAEGYAAANLQAVTQYKRLIEGLSLRCGLEEVPSYLYTCLDPAPLEAEANAYKEVRLPCELTRDTGLPFAVTAALRMDGQAQFHPLQFLRRLAAPLRIYEHTRVLNVQGGVITAEHGAVHAQKVIFACHFPFINHPGYYFIRMHQERSYCIAIEGIPPLPGTYLGIDTDGLSFRMAGNAVIVGGGAHRTGENRKGGQFNMLESRAKRIWPHSTVTARWSAQDCMPMDGIPYIGQFASDTPDWYVATGYQKWGMTTAMIAAHILTAKIRNTASEYEEIFTPQRFQPSASAAQLFRDTAEAVKGISRTAFGLPRALTDELPKGHGGIVSYNGEKVGIYKTPSGELHAVDPICPHLGCQLEWNPDTLSWDCPCHGSRFDLRGHLLDGPAQRPLRRLST